MGKFGEQFSKSVEESQLGEQDFHFPCPSSSSLAVGALTASQAHKGDEFVWLESSLCTIFTNKKIYIVISIHKMSNQLP